jgi:medium-chain acyl-[acyl-carrier-protein] hydrolase
MEGKMGKIRLFCLPHAGSSAVIYSKWKNYLDHSIELYPVELAGRGRRFQQPLYDSMEDAVADVYEQIRELIDLKPYAIFGHSMGSLIAYELYHKINQLHHHTPVHMFFSGRQAPHILNQDKIVYSLPDAEFRAEVLELGGTSREVFENEELMNIFLPILRADYKIVETYRYSAPQSLINCGISILHGLKDDMEIDEMKEWAIHTQKEHKLHLFDGGHFFIHEQVAQVVTIVNDTLKAV